MKKLLSITLLTAFVLLNACQKEVIPPVIADFNYTQSNNGIVHFYNASEYGESFEWDFGTGQNSTAPNPVYQFPQNKEYYVTLTVRGQGGQSSKSKTVKITSLPTTGKVVFWTSFNSEFIKIYVSGNYVGATTKYIPSGNAPSCETEGFVTVTLPEGTYSFTAKEDSFFGTSWSGTINVTNGICRSVRLTK